jgi:hypothetical protein
VTPDNVPEHVPEEYRWPDPPGGAPSRGGAVVTTPEERTRRWGNGWVLLEGEP